MSISAYQISIGGYTSVLDVFDMDSQSNSFMDTKTLLQIPLEWLQGRETFCLGRLETHCNSKEMGRMGYKEARGLLLITDNKAWLATNHHEQLLEYGAHLKIYFTCKYDGLAKTTALK